MSRLRYNGLATGSSGSTVGLTLGGSLTSGATSVTFAAALTYNNGTAVPTIAGSDYIPLSILDTNGNLSEIVYLTAYTAAATSGTITRGREGTTGVAHASGDKIVHAPTTTDAPLTLKPASLHATYGDDFTGGSLDAKWTRVTYTSGDETYAQGAGGTYLEVDTARAAGAYYYQAAPGGDFTLELGYVLQASISVMFGLIAVDTSGNGALATIYSGAPVSNLVGTAATAAYTSPFATAKGVAGAAYGMAGNVVGGGVKSYLRLQKTGTAWRSQSSLNGELWTPWTPTITATNTIARIGFGSLFGTPDGFAIDYFDVQ